MISGFLQLFCDISNEHTKSNDKNIYNVRELNYTWFTLNSSADPFADTTMGIPNDLDTFILWLKAGRYRNTDLADITMKKYGFKPLKAEWWHFTLYIEPFPNKYFNFKII